MWSWNSPFSDKALHIKGKDSKIKALMKWLKQDAHLDASGGLVSRAPLLEICLGMGIIWGDAHLIQFIEGDHTEETPDYIVSSTWGIEEYNIFGDYIERLYKELLHGGDTSRCVDSANIHKLIILME